MHLADQIELEPIYHYSDLDLARWFEFSLAIQDVAIKNVLSTKVTHIELDHSKYYPTLAERPKYSVFNFNVNAQYWRVNLISMLYHVKSS